jgi:hypothetical protein
MKIILVASLFIGVASASPLYLQSTIGGAGSFDRGTEHTIGSIAIGAAVYETQRFGIDLEVGYTHSGNVKPRSTIEHIDPPLQPEPIEPIIITKGSPLDSLPDIEPPVPKPIPEPDPEPIPVLEEDDPIIEVIIPIDIPINVMAASIDGIPEGVRINGQELKEYMPKFSTDLYQTTIGFRLKIGNFMWIQLRGGAEKKVIDGQIDEKTQKGEMINWRTKEKFRDDELTYIIGGAVLFDLRDQLKGVIKFDYHDLNNQVYDNDFQTDDIMVSAGLRFGF